MITYQAKDRFRLVEKKKLYEKVSFTIMPVSKRDRVAAVKLESLWLKGRIERTIRKNMATMGTKS